MEEKRGTGVKNNKHILFNIGPYDLRQKTGKDFKNCKGGKDFSGWPYSLYY